jgi:hypothetical protein
MYFCSYKTQTRLALSYFCHSIMRPVNTHIEFLQGYESRKMVEWTIPTLTWAQLGMIYIVGAQNFIF